MSRRPDVDVTHPVTYKSCDTCGAVFDGYHWYPIAFDETASIAEFCSSGCRKRFLTDPNDAAGGRS